MNFQMTYFGENFISKRLDTTPLNLLQHFKRRDFVSAKQSCFIYLYSLSVLAIGQKAAGEKGVGPSNPESKNLTKPKGKSLPPLDLLWMLEKDQGPTRGHIAIPYMDKNGK